MNPHDQIIRPALPFRAFGAVGPISSGHQRDGYENRVPTTRAGLEEARRLAARQATIDDMAAALQHTRKRGAS